MLPSSRFFPRLLPIQSRLFHKSSPLQISSLKPSSTRSMIMSNHWMDSRASLPGWSHFQSDPLSHRRHTSFFTSNSSSKILVRRIQTSKSQEAPSTTVESVEKVQRPIRWQENSNFSPASYSDLSKARLAALVVLTTMSGFAFAPVSAHAGLSTLMWTTLGTALCVSSANSINQWIEYPFDAQMSRTKNRVLVKHVLSPIHAFSFGIATAISGTYILYHFVNPVTAALGFANILLYTAVYTPMKRTSIANTWVGALVGAIPPMMGWTAVTGHLDPGAWLMGGFLYAWQFPHFNALSWNLRADYSKAGYRMMSVVNPALTTRIALRYSLLLLPLGWLAPYLGLTTIWFAYDSTLVSGIMAVLAYRFWKNPNEKTARSLFFSSLIHLPVILGLLLIHKSSRVVNEEATTLES